MNPQQFQQNMGMGRGMPNGNMQQANANNAMGMQAQKYIFQSLARDGPFTGWQTDVPIQERAGQVKLLVDSLRLLGQPVEMPRAIDVALSFERKEFAQSPTKEDYRRQCNEKLAKIRDQRQQNVVRANTASGMTNMQMINPNFQQQMQQMNQNMGFPQQQQPDMHASPMINQHQGQQNISQAQTMNPQMNAMQVNNQPKPTQPSELTAEDNKAINLRAAELARNTPKEDMRNIVEKMVPNLRANLSAKNVDPIIYHFRMLATKEFRQRQMQANNATQMNHNFNMMNQMQGTQQNVNTQAMNQNTQPGATPFLSNIDQFRGQQEAGLRSQEEGQLVVPASNSQNVGPEQLRLQQQMMANQQRMNQQNQNPNAAMNAQLIAQQRLKAQQNRQYQVAQMQAQQLQVQNQARAQAAGQGGMMQNVGQGQGLMQGMANPNTPMSMLNRPVGSGVPGTSPQNPSRPQSRAPMAGPQTQMGNPMMGQPQMNAQAIQNREQFLSRFPPQLQARLRTAPQNEWARIVQEFSNNAAGANSMRRSVSQQPGVSQPGQQPIQQLPNGQFLGGSTIPPPMQTSLSAGQAGNMQTPELGNGVPNMAQQQQQQQIVAHQNLLQQRRQAQLQQQQQQQQHQSQQRVPAAQQGPNNASGQRQPVRQLNPQEVNYMDQRPVHPSFLKTIQAAYEAQGGFLPEIRNWAQLKHHVSQNPTQKYGSPQLEVVQTNQYHFEMRQGERAKQQPGVSTAGQVPGLQQAAGSGQMQKMAAQAQGLGTALMRSISDEDLRKIRDKHPELENMPDPDLRNLMINRQRQMQQQAMANKNFANQQQAQNPQQFMPQQSQQGMQMPGQQAQMPGQIHQGQPSNASQAQLQQMQGMARSQSTRPQVPPQQMSGTPGQAESKNLKRSSQDDVVEVPNPTQPDNRQQQIPNLTKEAFEKLSPADQQKYMQAKKKQEAARRIAEFNKEVQATMPRTRPIMNMDVASRKRIVSLLTSDNTKNMLGRFENFLMGYYLMEHDETTLKSLISQRWHLLAQYKQHSWANRTYEPADHFSLSADNVESIIANITVKFQQTVAKVPQFNKQQASQQQPVPLTAENLTLASAQAAQQQKKTQKGKDVPPAAPTATQPPFTFGDNRGQGTPRYATPGFKPEDLKLPTDPKRRKKNPPNATPTATPNAAANATASPEVIKEQKVPQAKFKCTFVGCEHQLKGFSTPAELHEHVKTAHRPEMAPVTDPLAFLDNSLQKTFNLDEHFMPRQQAVESVVAAPMQKTVSKTGSNLKVESKPPTPVPMARGVSQQVPGKVGAPSSPNALKTPQSTKTDAKGRATQPVTEGQKDVGDPWANSSFGLDNLRDAFGDLEWSDVMPSLDKEQADLNACLEAYMKTEEWQKVMNDGTTATSSDVTTEKSKSPDQGSEQSPPNVKGQKQKQQQKDVAKDPLDVDLHIDGMDLPTLEGGFDELFMVDDGMGREKDVMMLDGDNIGASDGNQSPWEKVEKPSPDTELTSMADRTLKHFGISEPYATKEDAEFAAFLKQPMTLPDYGYGPDREPSPFEQIDFDELYENNGPDVWAAGTMEWNAVGKAGEEVRRKLGWPLAGASGAIGQGTGKR